MSRLNSLRSRMHRRWTVPVVSGTLIVLSWLAGYLLSGRTAEITHDVFMVAAAVVAGVPVVRSAYQALRVRTIGIDLLVSVALIGALAIGEYWEAAAVTFLFAVGHALEDATLAKTRSALAGLIELAPTTATVVRDGVQVEVAAHEVLPGELVVVKHGGKIPVDGDVSDGHAAVDEASITGESIPVEKAPGEKVFAGTILADGFLTITTTNTGADTTLARIIHRVEEAQEAKARTQQFMEKFSKWYTPGIIVLALVAGLITGNIELALTLLVIGCPGALVISVPVALVAGIGRAARDGVLIKGGEFLETAAKVNVVALDKTGTITQGRPEMTDLIAFGSWTADEVLAWAARAEAGSSHPLATPVLKQAEAQGITVPAVPEAVETVPGQGVISQYRQGERDGRSIAVGNPALLHSVGALSAEASAAADQLAGQGRTPLLVALDNEAIGAIGVADQIRPEAAELVAGLHRSGVKKVIMLTGDTERVARAIAAEVGIDDVRASLLPEDKLDAVRDLQHEGHTVAMVGDGVNDAPALALADVGIAMGAAGSPLAVETADIALMTSRLSLIPHAIGVAKRTGNVMRQNIWIALLTVGALLAGVLFGGVTMAIGMLVHEASVLIVIVNAMRLLRHRPDRPTEANPSRRAVVRQPETTQDEPVALTR
ncbi:heavy metal translocating P-type ATPase [Aestuariimicrobium ganziense]|uniref:heavy metal translocating P-type ATPase n=1 Tax=Aestuariimicrobium ganziense TaxID=2773677 RepID=UPI0019424E17|nr:cation-translocating P-type ATPase [Aestuariimicrobium ganziense]